MAVKDESVYHPTELLILKRPRRHFRASVSPPHWQLRSLIGASNSDTVYFPSGNGNLHIHKLNTTTLESETVKLLSFPPRCLVSKNGWICCGGETGEFAAVQVDNPMDGLELDPDARLPLELDPSRQDDAIFSLLARSRSNKSIVAKSKTFGKERVNCITLWFPPTQLQAAPAAYQRPVACLANNDKHAILVNLETQERLDELSYPDCVNRAVLSPDGRLLVAVSDDPFLYVHERVAKAGTSSQTGSRPDYEWKQCARVHLRGQRAEDQSFQRGSFAVCFSNTGKFLAVGTQYGLISIFDTVALTESRDALVRCFASSAPDTSAGAVREMSFCPGPFDLLAWSEDRGTVGVADVRSSFISRQILKLGDEAAYDHINLVERTAIDPRLLDSRNDRTDRGDTLASNLASTLDISTENRRSPRSRDNLDRYPSPLTADETQVLEALQEHRRRREQREQRERSAVQDYSGPRPPWSSRPSARSTLASDSSRTRERSASVTRAVNDILGNIQTQRDRIRSATERLRAREVDDERRRAVAPIPPRRTGAIRATDPEGAGGRESLVSRLIGTPTSTGWDNLEALYNISFESGQYDSLRMTDADASRRDRAAFIGSLISQVPMRDWDEDFTQMRLRAAGFGRDTPSPEDTAGLAWSDDGRILYVGAEDGIYEFQVNVMARKLYPSITMR